MEVEAAAEIEAAEATRPDPTEAADKVGEVVKAEVRNTAQSLRLKPAKCVIVIIDTETRLGTV